ncbi:MAG: hypothetical protein ACKO96_39935, partial [Flammeovirgaceae bacterium]
MMLLLLALSQFVLSLNAVKFVKQTLFINRIRFLLNEHFITAFMAESVSSSAVVLKQGGIQQKLIRKYVAHIKHKYSAGFWG